MLREYLSNIANKFRTHLDTTEPINAQDFAGKVEDVAVRYNQLGFTSGYNLGLEEGYNNAVRTGTITITERTKTLAISGLPSKPKTLSLFVHFLFAPTTTVEGEFYIAGLDYYSDGFFVGTNPNKRLGYFWLMNKNSIGDNVTFQERHYLPDLITFDNGTFTLTVRSSNAYYFVESYTYTWVATF